MKGIAGIVLVLVFAAIAMALFARRKAVRSTLPPTTEVGQPANSSGRVGADWSSSHRFIDKELARIETAKAELVRLGHMSKDFSFAEIVLGQYGWHGNGDGYFGAYSFYQPAFEQAKRGWFLNGKVLEGSNEFWSGDDTIRFDASVVGWTLPSMSMCYFKGGKMKCDWFDAKIVGLVDDGKNLLLDRRAPHYAEQWQMKIVPPDWVDMCACTNNFGPRFVDGRPQVTD